MSSNTIILVPLNIKGNAVPLQAGRAYLLRVDSVSLWTDGECRLMCYIEEAKLNVTSQTEEEET